MEESGAASDVDALVAQLRARVEDRRQAGEYPPDLEERLSEHFGRIVRQRGSSRPTYDLQAPLAALRAALPVGRARIPVDSDVPGGAVLHRAVAKAVGRQTEGVLQQVQGFAQPAADLLASLVATVEGLQEEVRGGLLPRVDAVLERQAAQERALAGTTRVAAGPAGPLADRFDGRAPSVTLEAADGLGPLQVAGIGSLGGLGVVGLVERLSADEVADLVALAAEKLRPGGTAVVEIAPATSAVHPANLAFLFATAGFAAVEIEWRVPPDGLEQRLLAPPAYLVIATR